MASEYGWTKDYILNSVYPDDAWELGRSIRTRKHGEYLMQLAIVQNPWAKEPRRLWEMLEKESSESEHVDEIDRDGIKRLKAMMNKGSRNTKK